MLEDRWAAVLPHRERLLRIAIVRCPSRDDAEDVVQEAMLRCVAFEGLDERRIGPFLTSVTTRLCADVHRAHQRGEGTLRRLVPVSEATEGPEEQVCRTAEAGRLKEIVRRLPTKQRDVLVDRASGLSLPQISRRHGLTYKAAESALSRARAAARAALVTGLAVVAVLRRGRTATVVAPLTVLVVATAVLRHSAPGIEAPPIPREPVVRVGASRTAAAVREPVRRPEASTGRRAARAVARPAAPAVRTDPPPRFERDFSVPGPVPNRTRVSDTRKDPSPVAFAQDCVGGTFWVDGDISAAGSSARFGCYQS